MIKCKGSLALNVVVPVLAKRVVPADENLALVNNSDSYSDPSVTNILATPRQLRRGQLLLVVLLKGRSSGLEEIWLFDGESFDIWLGVIIILQNYLIMWPE